MLEALSPSSSGPGLRPFTAAAPVRIRSGMPSITPRRTNNPTRGDSHSTPPQNTGREVPARAWAATRRLRRRDPPPPRACRMPPINGEGEHRREPPSRRHNNAIGVRPCHEPSRHVTVSTRRVRQVVAWVTTTIIATVSNGPENVAWAYGTPVFPALEPTCTRVPRPSMVPILRARMDGASRWSGWATRRMPTMLLPTYRASRWRGSDDLRLPRRGLPSWTGVPLRRRIAASGASSTPGPISPRRAGYVIVSGWRKPVASNGPVAQLVSAPLSRRSRVRVKSGRRGKSSLRPSSSAGATFA